MQVSIISIRSLIAEVKRLGHPVEPLLRSLQLEEAQLTDTRLRVPSQAAERVIAEALALTHTPSLGLSIGGLAPEFQLMSHFAQALPTLRDAITMLQRYAPIFVDDVHIDLHEAQGLAYFRYGFGHEPTSLCERFFGEVFSGHCIRVAKRFFTEGSAPAEVRFRHPEPDYVERYREVFDCPVYFGCDESTIVFDASRLDRPQPYADPFMADLLRDACERMLGTIGQRSTCAQRVRTALKHQPDLCSVDTEAVARELGLTPRSLRAQLAEEGVTFTALVEEARIEAAAIELLRPGVTIKEAAAKLGYSEVSAFHRAFKRWMGKTPGEYVRSQRGQSG